MGLELVSGVARNWALAQGAISNGQTATIYTVPASYTAIIKDARFSTSGVVLTQISLYAQEAVGSVFVWIIPSNNPNRADYEWSGWVVLNPGDHLILTAVGAATNYWLSGALLNTGGLPMPTSLVAGTLPVQPDVPPPNRPSGT